MSSESSEDFQLTWLLETPARDLEILAKLSPSGPLPSLIVNGTEIHLNGKLEYSSKLGFMYKNTNFELDLGPKPAPGENPKAEIFVEGKAFSEFEDPSKAFLVKRIPGKPVEKAKEEIVNFMEELYIASKARPDFFEEERVEHREKEIAISELQGLPNCQFIDEATENPKIEKSKTNGTFDSSCLPQAEYLETVFDESTPIPEDMYE